MKILIIGGNGFVGEYLSHELVFGGVDEVHVVGHNHKNDLNKEVVYHTIDLDNNFSELEELFNSMDVVILAIQPNQAHLQSILDGIEKSDNVKKIVYLSTVLLYPDSDLLQNEDNFLEPKTEYERRKLEEESQLKSFVENKDLVLTIARLGNVYGDIKNKGIINHILLALINNQIFKINGDGSQIRDYVLVDDVAKCLALLVHHHQKNKVEVVNIATGVGTTVTEVIELVEDTSNRQLETINVEPIAEKHAIIADNRKLTGMIGKYCFTGLDLGLYKTYQKYLKHYKN